MTTGVATSPSEYITNTDETDALALNASAELSASESVTNAACELRDLYTRVTPAGQFFPSGATVASNVVTQPYDARVLAPGRYEWIWTLTLNTGAIRSYRTLFRVENHD
jgi:hypothetical protein